MKILKFVAENIKRLKVVEITPKGALIQVTGANEAGKTSVLDAIWWALTGGENIDPVPLRRGAEKGKVVLELGDLIVERTFTQKDSYLKVRPGDNPKAKYDSPQEVLDALIGKLAFDPLSFSRMSDKEQFNTLRSIAKLDIDIDALEAENKKDADARTETNRAAKTALARVLNDPTLENLPAQEIDEQAIIARLSQAGDHNSGITVERAHRAASFRQAEEHQTKAEAAAESILSIQSRFDEAIADLNRRIKKLEEERDSAIKAAAFQRDANRAAAEAIAGELALMDPLPDPVDPSTIRAELGEAQATNAKIRRKRESDAWKQQAEELHDKAEWFTKSIAQRESLKKEAVSKASMPVPGLGFGDGYVTLDGLPFSQASDAQRLAVSVAIAMEANPKLRIIRIRDGSLLDDNALERLATIAAERDYQVWLERVDTSGKIGVVIEDGQVAADNQ